MTCQKHDITNIHKVLTDFLDGKLPKFMQYPEGFSGGQSSGSMPDHASPVDEGAELVINTVPHDPAAADTSVEEACAATTDRDIMEPASSSVPGMEHDLTGESPERRR